MQVHPGNETNSHAEGNLAVDKCSLRMFLLRHIEALCSRAGMVLNFL